MAKRKDRSRRNAKPDQKSSKARSKDAIILIPPPPPGKLRFFKSLSFWVEDKQIVLEKDKVTAYGMMLANSADGTLLKWMDGEALNKATDRVREFNSLFFLHQNIMIEWKEDLEEWSAAVYYQAPPFRYRIATFHLPRNWVKFSRKAGAPRLGLCLLADVPVPVTAATLGIRTLTGLVEFIMGQELADYLERVYSGELVRLLMGHRVKAHDATGHELPIHQYGLEVPFNTALRTVEAAISIEAIRTSRFIGHVRGELTLQDAVLAMRACAATPEADRIATRIIQLTFGKVPDDLAESMTRQATGSSQQDPRKRLLGYVIDTGIAPDDADRIVADLRREPPFREHKKANLKTATQHWLTQHLRPLLQWANYSGARTRDDVSDFLRNAFGIQLSPPMVGKYLNRR